MPVTRRDSGALSRSSEPSLKPPVATGSRRSRLSEPRRGARDDRRGGPMQARMLPALSSKPTDIRRSSHGVAGCPQRYPAVVLPDKVSSVGDRRVQQTGVIGGHGDEIEAFLVRPHRKDPRTGVIMVHHMRGSDGAARKDCAAVSEPGSICPNLHRREGLRSPVAARLTKTSVRDLVASIRAPLDPAPAELTTDDLATELARAHGSLQERRQER